MKWLAFFFAIFIALIIVLANMGELGGLGFVNQIPYGDKAAHFILYGFLTIFIDLALIRSRAHHSPTLIVISTGIITSLLIGIEEFSQQFLRNRTFSLLDLTFGYLGVIFFSWVALRNKYLTKDLSPS